MSKEISSSVSKFEQDSHLRIFNETVNKEQFEGIHIKGTFEEPALVFTMDRFPSKSVINMMANSIKRKEDSDYHMYLYSRNKEQGLKWGMIDKSIDKIHIIEEFLYRYGLKIFEIKDGERREVSSTDFITTLKLG